MSRTASAGLLSHLAESTTTLATLVLIQRTDGVTLGLTNADAKITFGGVDYMPADGMGATAIEQTAGVGVNNQEIDGFISDSRITEDDILAGRYDGATFTVMIVNRADLSLNEMILERGRIGEVEIEDDRFRAETRGLADMLRQTIGDVTSPTCICEQLGGAKCKLSMVGNALNGHPKRTTLAVSSVADQLNLRFSSSAPTDHFTAGVLSATSGSNNGLKREIKKHVKNVATAEIELRDVFPFAVVAGDTFQLEAGCDRKFATCRDKFGNANNFHGQHKLPGNDKVGKIGRNPTA